MDRHRALLISGSWSPGAARAVDDTLLLHGPLQVDRNTETAKKSERVDATSRHHFLMEKPEIEVLMGLALYCGTSNIRDIASTVRDIACCTLEKEQ
jgi:hypothetical protein